MKQLTNYHLDLAKTLAKIYHKGQTDKSGNDYYNHLFRVAEEQKTVKGKIVGYLHDLLEDTDFAEIKGGYLYSINDLIDKFDTEVVQNLIWLKKDKGVSYKFYIDKLCMMNSQLAINVKLADLGDNMNLSRLNKIELKDIKRFFKYLKFYIKLKWVLFSLKFIK